jgi:predicted site-specific integrase-resolvase
MNSKWISLNEAVGILGISLSTLRRRINKGEFETKLVDGNRFVRVSNEVQVDSNAVYPIVEKLKDEVQELHQRLEREEKRNKELQRQLDDSRKAADEASHRHDTVVMQMTKLLEYHQQPFWRKLFSRKALPSRVDEPVMDIHSTETKDTEGE